MQNTITLSPAERLLVEWAHNDHAVMKKNADDIMQQRLNTIAQSHNVPDGSQMSFLKHPDNSMTLQFEGPEQIDAAGKIAGHIDNGEGEE